MELKNLNAVIDLLGSAEFEEFKNEIRQQLRAEMALDAANALAEAERAKKEIKAYRTSLAKLEKHVRGVLLYYKIPLEKIFVSEGEELLTPVPASAPPVPTPAPAPPVPPLVRSVVQLSPAIAEALRPLPRYHKNFKPSALKPEVNRHPVLSDYREREALEKGIIDCLRAAVGKRKTGVSSKDILSYLTVVVDFPMETPYWQHQGRNDKRTRIADAVRYQLRKLRIARKVKQEHNLWYWTENAG